MTRIMGMEDRSTRQMTWREAINGLTVLIDDCTVKL